MSRLDLPPWSRKFHPPYTCLLLYSSHHTYPETLGFLLPGISEKLGAPLKLLPIDSMDVGSPHAMSYFLQCLGPAVSPSDQQFIHLK